MTAIAIVVNGLKADSPEAAAVRAAAASLAAERSWPEPSWRPTTESDAGRDAAARAVGEGAELVIAVGGDGTVSSCAAALAGTGVPMGIVPMGTGNLIARNLGLPTDAGQAVAVAATDEGVDRALDVGRSGDRVVVGMAGIGLDAAMIADAPAGLKRRWGWPAYAVSMSRHLADRGFTLHLTLDDRVIERHHVRALVAGNMGRLQGGVELLPDACTDSGHLDVVVIAPRWLLGWVPVFVTVVARRSRSTRRVERFQATHMVARSDRPVRQEIDGEECGESRVLEIVADPAALIVRVPVKP